MASSEQAVPRRRNWPVDLSGAIGAGAGVVLAPLAVSLTDFHNLWTGMIAGGVGAGLGLVLGRLAGSAIFRRPPDNKPLA